MRIARSANPGRADARCDRFFHLAPAGCGATVTVESTGRSISGVTHSSRNQFRKEWSGTDRVTIRPWPPTPVRHHTQLSAKCAQRSYQSLKIPTFHADPTARAQRSLLLRVPVQSGALLCRPSNPERETPFLRYSARTPTRELCRSDLPANRRNILETASHD
jgi:hypothetical protein